MSQKKDRLIKIDIGCGKNKKKGFLGVDNRKDSNADYIINLENENLPFKNNKVDEVYARHSLEHIKNIEHILREIYRVCRNGAIVMIIVPHWQFHGAYSNLFHYHRFTEHTFNYFDKTKSEKHHNEALDKINFKVLSVKVKRGALRFWKPYEITYILKTVKQKR